jgi:hypothetical protein
VVYQLFQKPTNCKVFAIKHPEYNDYPVPVSLFCFPKTFDEMRMFYIVNSRQRSVPTDLALHHLQRTITEVGVAGVVPFESQQRVLAAQSLDIVKILNTEPTSPWLGRVQFPNEPKGPNHVIKERPLADSIGFILKDYTVTKQKTIRNNPRVLAEPLIDYWNALKDIFPDAFANPQEYTIQKSTGAYSLHMIFPRVFSSIESLDEKKWKDKMKEVLSSMFRDVVASTGFTNDSEFWNKKTGYPLAMGTSMKLMKALASLFLDNIPESD